MSIKGLPDLYTAHRADQREALTSPIRLEILGLFTAGQPLAVADMAARMGRPPNSVHYHVRLLERVGLLRRFGTGERGAARYGPVARQIALPTPTRGAGRETALRTIASAFRMAERDMESALEEGTFRAEGEDRNFVALRLHARLSARGLARVNRHIDGILEVLAKERVGRRGEANYCSLTLALLPLRGRGKGAEAD
jgi:hypothetical protein